MSSPEGGFDRGPVDERGDYFFDQERLARDTLLTQRVQAGYTRLVKHDIEQPIIEGTLTEDAAAALKALWEVYYPAALGTANRKRGLVEHMPAVDVDDLIHEAFLGLYHSAVTWQPGESTFLTAASQMMSNYTNRYIQNNRRTVRLKGNIRDGVNRTQRKAWTLYQREERFPSRERLGKALGVSAERIEKLMTYVAFSDQMGSLEGGYFKDDRDRKSIGQVRRDGQWRPVNPAASQPKTVEAEAITTDLVDRVRNAVVKNPWNLTFSERELYILEQRYFNPDGPVSLDEIGEHFNLSRERIRQIESRLLTKLRHPSASGRLSHLLD